jgi:aminoglycoside phosphotransferase (APT) family kinase protein
VAIASGTRDPERLRAGFERWLRAKRPDLAAASVGTLDVPATGLSSDTAFAEVRSGRSTRSLVVRLPPVGEGLFPIYDLAGQAALQCALAGAGVAAVPATYEADLAWIGSPFMVMERIAGRVVTTTPPYVAAGWLAAADPAEQTRVRDGFLDALADLHRVDPARVDVMAATPAEALEHWSDYLDWASGPTPAPEYLMAAREALRTSVPDPGGDCVLWGDAQLANCVFADDGAVAAVLDFELASRGPAEMDLGWFVALHTMTAAVAGRDLPAFARSEVVAAYERRSGRPLVDLTWFERFALLRSGAIMVRIARLLARRGLDDSWLTRENPTERALRALDSEE